MQERSRARVIPFASRAMEQRRGRVVGCFGVARMRRSKAVEPLATRASGVLDAGATAPKQPGVCGIVRVGREQRGEGGSCLLVAIVSIESDAASRLQPLALGVASNA